ncbi:hypothetical protein [Streptomyces sp. NBC_01615]|uniref:hypothetical protein n=1 Tax=Streptomyces sp. NBC_01615 TaxID=2975898 RepID=UPI00386D549E
MALTRLAASAAAFALALLSAVAGFGGGDLLLPVFTALFGLRTAIPVLTLAQRSPATPAAPPSTAASWIGG